MIKHVDITITGKVQGVGFRYCALEQALDLEIHGLVRNKDSNAVYIEIEGDVDKLKQFLRWCHRGPEGSRIEKIDYVSTEDLKGFEEFKVEF